MYVSSVGYLIDKKLILTTWVYHIFIFCLFVKIYLSQVSNFPTNFFFFQLHNIVHIQMHKISNFFFWSFIDWIYAIINQRTFISHLILISVEIEPPVSFAVKSKTDNSQENSVLLRENFPLSVLRYFMWFFVICVDSNAH